MTEVTLRDKLIEELKRVYFEKTRKGSITEDMADAVLALLKKERA